MKNVRIDWVVVITATVLALSGCGGGCGGCGMEPIPGGFPPAKRTPNAVQVRVTPTALAAISANPATLLGNLAGGMGGILKFNVPASCGGSTPICCPNNNPVNPCGPIDIDLTKQVGDLPRLELRPAQGASRLDVTVRARVKTEMDIPVKVPVVGDCAIKIDTTAGSTKDIQIDAPISFVQDATAGTTRIAVGDVTLNNLASEDVKLNGGIGCQLANLGLGFFLGILKDQLTGAIKSAIQDQTCKACPSGMVGECGGFATACTNNVCMEGADCLQELGIDGRLRGSGLFGSLSPGTLGAIDLYEVAGGYATSNNNGLALGLLGGILPAGTDRDRCGPPGTAPAAVTIPQSAFFQGNVRPDNNLGFDVGFGIHKSQLAEFAFAGYDGGLLCLTIGGSTVAQLNTDTIGLLSRSLGDLVETSSPMALGLRPQSPPVITLGKNRFTTDAMGNSVLSEPLLDLKFTQMEIDFFASVDDQYIRVFTVVADVHLPIGLQVMGMGKLTPVLGSISDAFTNVTVKHTEAVTETPAQLAALFPTLLNLVLPQLSGGLSPISLPSIGGLDLSVVDITAVDNDTFLAIFANLVVAPAIAPHVDTHATLAGVTEPARDVARAPSRWKGARAPSVELGLSTTTGGARHEWAYRINGGTWSAWSTNPRPSVSSASFWLPGQHRIEVVGREVGRPETIDDSPEVIEVVLGGDLALPGDRTAKISPFHGQSGGTGCACDSGGSPAGAAPLALVLLMIMLPWRRIVRRMRRARALRLGPVVWGAAIALSPGCSCSSAPCGDTACLDGELPNGGLGRFTSIAGDDSRVMVATYDTGLGDLVVVDATDPAKLGLVVVDGIPDGVTPTYDPGTYRGGIEDAGPDVGAWTSIALIGGKAKVAYQDRTEGETALKYAYEKKVGQWASYVLDPSNGLENVGSHAAMTVDGSGHPAIAYLSVGNDDGMGHRTTELRLARAGSADPKDLTDWTVHVIASGTGTCAGLCNPGQACIAGAAAGDPEVCTTVETSCAPACGSGDACIAGACATEIPKPTVAQLATGTGLYVNLTPLADGRLAATYYDRNKRALVLAVESSAGASTFAETVLDQVTPGDRGMWTSTVADGAGVLHIAYQDALGDQLMYTSWNGSPGTPEVVDDGQRAGDRTHPVGAGASIYLVNGSPTIAYQDGMTADVYVATKSGATWSKNALASGPLLDGFSIAVTTVHASTAYAAWGAIDPSAAPNRNLVVVKP